MSFFQKMLKAWAKPKRPEGVRCFSEDQKNAEAFDNINRGTLCVPLDRIVGSVGRYNDFDGKFQPRDHLPTDRFNNIKQAMREGRRIPPVKLYQIKDEYFVLDGHHRIAAAKSLGRTEIDAKIVEFIPSKDTLENLLYRQRARFSEKTSLPHDITLTEVGQYDHLLSQIELHRKYMARSGETVSVKDAAADWYRTIYMPLITIIRKGDLLKSFPSRTIDDLYLYVSVQLWEKGRQRQYGIGINRLIPKDMEAFRNQMARKRESEYPEMLRQITTFILMNVKGKHEDRIMDKLYSLDEVREIHSVHGTVDLLVKVVLTRDLLTSDAEIIADFVNREVRQMSGIVSTQTLIPGESRIKVQSQAVSGD